MKVKYPFLKCQGQCMRVVKWYIPTEGIWQIPGCFITLEVLNQGSLFQVTQLLAKD